MTNQFVVCLYACSLAADCLYCTVLYYCTVELANKSVHKKIEVFLEAYHEDHNCKWCTAGFATSRRFHDQSPAGGALSTALTTCRCGHHIVML